MEVWGMEQSLDRTALQNTLVAPHRVCPACHRRDDQKRCDDRPKHVYDAHATTAWSLSSNLGSDE